MDLRKGLGRIRRSIGAGAGAVAIAVTAFVVYAAIVPTGEVLTVGSKRTPHSLTVHSAASLPPEVQAQEAATAPFLFDRDTTTEHVAFDVSDVEAALEAPQEIRAVKVHGPAPYVLTVQAEAAGSYQTIAGLENLNLTQLPAGWSAFSATTPVTTARLRFTLTPATGGVATGLQELEVWTTAAPVNADGGEGLLAQMLGPTPPAQGRVYLALNPTANPTVGVIMPSGDDTADNFFHFTLDRDPAHFARAYLTYELLGQAHWVAARRYINDIMSNAGGALLLPTDTGSLQVERINPAWLQVGANTIEFGVLSSSFKDAGYTVRDVRILLEFDNGANVIESIQANQPDATGTNPVAALYDGNIATGWQPYPFDQPINAAAPAIEFDFRRPTQMDAVSFYLSAPLAGELQVSVKQAGVWIDHPPEQGSVLSTGWNTIPVPPATPLAQRVLEGVKLTFLGGHQSSAEIRELVFTGSGVGARTRPPKFIITYPDQGQFHGRRAFVQGFLEPWDNGSGRASITLGGRSALQLAGTVSSSITKDDIGLTAQADNDPWSVEVKAVYPDGETVSALIELTEQQSQATAEEGALAAAASATLFAKRKANITHDETNITADSGTVASDTEITITPLAEESVPALDVGMTNVTKGPRRGYRFLPHGSKFLKKINVKLPYNKALIPPGHTEEDVKTFYFDEQAGRWIALERASVDKTNKMVTSLTDHFTDMINAVVTVPDHPEAVSFNPTSMKDIKAADPGAQVNLIEAPQVNNQGDARLSYPIEVPPGRQGLQPQLSVNYNSSGGNGWLGVGWDLSVPSISIDTRFGVPRYDTGQLDPTRGALETETYLLNGEQLTPVAHRGDLQARNTTGSKTFHTRVEGQFRRIIRHGTHPANYWWEVTDKNGVKSIYGGNLATQSPDPTSVLADPRGAANPNEGHVFKWMLREMRDPNGNTMRYHYDIVEGGDGVNSERWRQIYLSRITYTGSNGSDGPYEVRFNRAGGRADVTIDARGGFKTVLDQRLTGVDVLLTTESNPLVRRYIFVYDENPYGDNRVGTAFNKSLLTGIVQIGEDGITEFNRHRFEYLDEVRDPTSAYNGFTGPTPWSTGSDGLAKSFLGIDASLSALGGNVGTSRNADAYVGVGPISPGNKGTSGGVKVGSSSSENDGAVAFADVDGDGLPDKVFDCNESDSKPPACGQARFVYRPNQSGPGPSASTDFGEAAPLVGLPGISSERGKDSFRGGEGYVAGVSGLASSTRSTVTQSIYFTDANGDGLTDVVVNGSVRFNRLVNGVPTFVGDSTLTPAPIDQGQPIDADGTLPSFADLQNELITDHPLMDAVRRWVAPFSGQIEITGDFQLIDATATDPARADYLTADGVRVAIQHNAAEVRSTLLGPTDYDLQTLAPTTLPVNRGDRIYFRVQSRFDGAYDDVRWNPQIAYVGQPADATDVNRRPLFRYRASEDFIFGGRASAARLPFTGTVRLLGDLSKNAPTTDDVTLAVYLLSTAELNAIGDLNVVPNFKTPALARTLTFDQVGTISLTPGTHDLAVQEGQFLLFLVQTDSPIDVTAIQWQPQVVYVEAFSPSTQATDEDGNPVDVGTPAGSPLPVQDGQGRPLIKIDPLYDVDLYPVNDLIAPQQAWIAPQTGTLTVVPQIETAEDDTTTDSTLVVTVKRKGPIVSERLGKQVVTITDGNVSAPSFTVSVTQGDELYFDISTRDATVAGKLTTAAVAATFGNPDPDTNPPEIVPSAFHRANIAQAFAESYRNWSYVGYNGNDSCEQKKALGDTNPCTEPPINENRLVLTDATEPSARFVYPAFPRAAEFRWVAEDDRWQVRADALSASRHGLDDVSVPVSSAFAAAPAVPRISRNSQSAAGGGFYVSVSTANSDSTSLLDFLDLNGDRYPDVVSAQNFVQYSLPTGRLEANKRTVNAGGVRTSKSSGNTISGPGALPQLPRSGKSDNKQENQQQQTKPENQSPSFSISGSLGEVNNESTDMLLDINGDGLADRVTESNGVLFVRLNLGYRFSERAEQWGFANLSKGRNVNASLSAGFSDIWRGFSGGANVATSKSETLRLLSDLNGDGLPDALFNSSGKLKVAFNKGDGFLDPVDWSDDRALGDGRGFNLGGGFSYEIDIPIPLAGIVIVINPAASVGESASRSESVFEDIDGDGYADHLASTRDHTVEVRANRTGRTNLLKKVYRPLGATFGVEYTRDGNTFDLPESRWVISKVSVFDGHAGDGADRRLTTFRYLSPKYDRREREFYGYAQVIEEQRDTQNADALYRTITREFLNDSFYTKGLLKRELVQDHLGAPFTETENIYVLRDVDTGVTPADTQSTTATIFPQLTRTDKRFYEGKVTPGKTTFTTHEYDNFGNVIRFTDAGDVGAVDDVDATIGYTTHCVTTTYVIKPDRITVKGNGLEQRRREADIDCLTGNLTEVREYLATGQFAQTKLTYEPNGNLSSVQRPANLAGQTYTLFYAYDQVVATHVVDIRDSFGLSSQATYNFKHAKAETTTDTNGNQTTYKCDAFGRVDFIFGPYEQGQIIPTLDFEYAPVETATRDASGNTVPLTRVPWALTRHVDKDAAGNYKPSGTIDTILFTDGLKRVLQTKKDATVLATTAQDVMTVSGQVRFDAFGRTVEQFYPVTEGKSADNAANVIFNPNALGNGVAPTVTEYDVLDRVIRTTLPDTSFTTIVYGFGVSRASPVTQFLTTVRDNNVNDTSLDKRPGAIKHTFRDVRELITSVREQTTTGDIWTSYEYDALKQITKVTDDQGNETTVTYDNLGRRTSINNPDTGLTTFAYDLASNLTQKVTANLRAAAQAIAYDYDFNRLVAVRYPTFTDNNIRYTYGAPGAPNNSAGRITKVISRTTTNSNGQTFQDSEERHYGKLGEVIFEKKTVVTFTDPNHPSVFETSYQFDTFGRLQKLVYPDGEVLTNTYDSGGNLQTAKGEKNGFRYDYLKALFYDEFEQRVLIEQGNGIKTAYTYNAQTRRLDALTAGGANGNLFQNLAYRYDKVGNILNLKNTVDIPPASTFGGPTDQSFVYDELYRLTKAQGSFQFAPDKTHVYSFDLGYDSIHNIRTKKQVHNLIQPSGVAIGQKKTSYDWTYLYQGTQPHAPTHIGERSFTYDLNGNQTGYTHDKNGTNRTIVWNEENRVESIADQGHVKTYKYDDQGTRTIKRGPQGETVYVNQFFTQRPGATGTKHVYAGTSRIVSKLMRQDTPGANPQGRTPFEKDLYFFHPDHLGSSSYITDTNGKVYEHLEYFPFGEAWVEESSNTQRAPYLFTAKELDEETGLYYFGARYYDPRTSVWQSADPILDQYLPDAPQKEDEVIKLLPPTVHQPFARFDLPGMGGVFNTKNLGLYSYSHLNPLRYYDPDGNEPEGAESPNKGARVLKGTGHHMITNATARDLKFSSEALKVFDSSENRIPVEGHNAARPCPSCPSHQEYSKAERKFVTEYLEKNKIDPTKMTEAQAKDLVRAIKTTREPTISRFNRATFMKAFNQSLRRIYRRFPYARGND